MSESVTSFSIPPSYAFPDLQRKATGGNIPPSCTNKSVLSSLLYENQVVLLCLDYLRDLRRHCDNYPEELEYTTGMNADYISLAIWALSKSFVRPKELSHEYIPEDDLQYLLQTDLDIGNDPFFQNELADLVNFQDDTTNLDHLRWTDKITIPSIKDIEHGFLYSDDPRKFMESAPSETKSENSRSTWYTYQDAHVSNANRIYPLRGLSSTPLSLTELLSAGMKVLEGRTRESAENDIANDELFSSFVQAVEDKGFFNITDKQIFDRVDCDDLSPEEIMLVKEVICAERHRKVVRKFRTKLASKMEHESEEKTTDISHSVNHQILEEGEDESHEDSADAPAADDHNYDSQSQSGWGGYDDDTITGASVFHESFSHSYKENRGSLAANLRPQTINLVPVKRNIRKQTMDQAELLKSKGNSEMQKKEYSKAHDYYTEALSILPDGPSSHIYYSNRAASYLSMRKFREAIQDSQHSLALKPDYGKGHSRLGLAYYLLGEFEHAYEAYTQALKYEPSNEVMLKYLEKSKMMMNNNKNTKMIDEEEASLKSTRTHMTSKSTRSLQSKITSSSSNHAISDAIHTESNLDIPGRSSSTESKSKASTNGTRRAKLEKIKSSSSPPTANKVVADTPKPKNYASKTINGTPKRKNGGMHQLLDTSRDIKTPNLVQSTRSNNGVNSTIKRPSTAPIQTSSSSTSNPTASKESKDMTEADRHKSDGNRFMAKKDYEQAIKSYSMALRLCPAGPSSYLYFSNRAAAMCYLERYEEAELDSERSLALKPDYSKAHARLGLSRYFLKDYEGAVEAYEAALFYEPDNLASKSYLEKAKAKLSSS